MIEDLTSYDPSSSEDKPLADDFRICSAWYASLVSGKPIKFSKEEILDCHKKITAELLKRAKVTFHPEHMKDTSLELLRHSLDELIKGGLYLVKPHAEYFCLGQKTAMVKSRNFKRCLTFNILCSNDLAYGFIRFRPPREITLDEFAELRPRHSITEDERAKWWPTSRKLFFYELRDFVPYETPIDIAVPQGVQVFIDEVSVKHQTDFSSKEDRQAWLISQAHNLPDFVWKPDYISITGSSIFAERLPHDMDIVLRDDTLDTALRIKLERALLENFPDLYPHFVPSTAGPNWPYLSIYDLCLIKKPEFKITSINEPEFERQLYHQRAATAEVAKQARESREEDKLKLFRFYLVLKPTRITLAGERQTVDRFVSYFPEEDFPVLNSKKFDGVHLLIFRKGDKVEFWSDDGSQFDTARMPSAVKELTALKADNFIIEAELEQWLDKVHQPREAVAAKLHRREIEDDADLLLNVFTCVFFNDEDLHNESESRRQDALDSLGIKYSTTGVPDLSHKLNKVPNDLCSTSKKLKDSTEKLRYLPASEGVVAKKANSVYFLDGNAKEGWIKFHNNALLTAKVIEAIETRTAGVWNYRYGIRPGDYAFKKGDLAEVGDEELVEVGKTFSTDFQCSRGDLIQVEFETFNLTHDSRTDVYTVSAWAPVFFAKLDSRGEPDELDAILKRAEKEHILQQKEITEEGETVYL